MTKKTFDVLAKELSDALLTLRPLGGSECFSRHFVDGEEVYLADVKFFRGEIERLRSRLPAQGGQEPLLWCCHVRGPDDIYAAPDYVTALAWSDAMNEINWKANSRLNIGDPTSFQDCLIKAVPAPWPHSPEAHAKNLPESIRGFSDPSAHPSTERRGPRHPGAISPEPPENAQ